MSEDLEQKLEKVISLLGPNGHKMTLSELVEQIVNLSLQKLKEKKFGKTRAQSLMSEKVKSEIIEPRELNQTSFKKEIKPKIWTSRKDGIFLRL